MHTPIYHVVLSRSVFHKQAVWVEQNEALEWLKAWFHVKIKLF